jgi:AraC-type DNA-binding domain-containing proteins
MTEYIGKTPINIDLGFVVDADKPVLPLALDVFDTQCAEMHKHPRAQLIYSCKGVMKVLVKDSIWLVSPNQAIWVPSMMDHQVFFLKENHIRNLYFDPSVASGLPQGCFTFNVSPFLRELILKIVTHDEIDSKNSPASRLIMVLLDELTTIAPAKCFLPTSNEPHIRKVIDILANHPGDKRDLTDFAEIACISPRTLVRLFTREVGMSFGSWRKQVRLMAAIEMLTKGIAVSQVSMELGYNSSSAFAEMFRKEFGTSPGRYLEK